MKHDSYDVPFDDDRPFSSAEFKSACACVTRVNGIYHYAMTRKLVL